MSFVRGRTPIIVKALAPRIARRCRITRPDWWIFRTPSWNWFVGQPSTPIPIQPLRRPLIGGDVISRSRHTRADSQAPVSIPLRLLIRGTAARTALTLGCALIVRSSKPCQAYVDPQQLGNQRNLLSD